MLRDAVADAPNIRIDTRILPPGDSHALTAAADIVLSLHRSEGFRTDPPPRRCCSGASRHRHRLVRQHGLHGRGEREPDRAPLCLEAPGAVWGRADQRAAVSALRRLADYPEARTALGARGRLAATERLGLGPLAWPCVPPA